MLRFCFVFVGACVGSSNSKVIKLVYVFLNKLMALFPAEKSSVVACKHEELCTLYTIVNEVCR